MNQKCSICKTEGSHRTNDCPEKCPCGMYHLPNNHECFICRNVEFPEKCTCRK